MSVAHGAVAAPPLAQTRGASASWGFAELFVISQTALPALLYLPGTQPFRLPIRVSAFAISLAAFCWWLIEHKSRVRQSRAHSWIAAIMFLQTPWFVPELIATFDAYDDLGLLCLSRGLNCSPCPEPIERWEDLIDWRRLQSTIGTAPANWLRLQEVDAVLRPWVVRRACLDRVGVLDEAFRPTEWDEADLAFRIRTAGWKVATHGYERLGAYVHLGSTTLGKPSQKYLDRVLANGRLFHGLDPGRRRAAGQALVRRADCCNTLYP